MLVRNTLITIGFVVLSLAALADGNYGRGNGGGFDGRDNGGWNRDGGRDNGGRDHNGRRDHGDWDHNGSRDHGGGERMVCVARNFRGAEYFGNGFGREAYKMASDEAMMKCYRDSFVPGTCQIINCR